VQKDNLVISSKGIHAI